jgi:hypothetical protein
MFILAREHKNVIDLNLPEDDVFENRNLFSSNNQAEIYYDSLNKNYLFLCSKGDSCKNKFGAELYEGDNLIYSGQFTYCGSFYVLLIKNDTTYTVKYYDGDISNDTLSKTLTVFTDSTKSATPNNWIQFNN